MTRTRHDAGLLPGCVLTGVGQGAVFGSISTAVLVGAEVASRRPAPVA